MSDFMNKFPYSDAHELNLDWIISKVKEIDLKTDNILEYNSIRYADPIEWSISNQYPALNIVYNESDEILYVSKQFVPKGIAITNTDYWQPVSPFSIDSELSDSSVNPVSNRVITEALNARTNYTVIKNETVTLDNGNFIYENCTINEIDSETVVTGEHIFKGCDIDTLFIRNGYYKFYDCTFDYIRIVSSDLLGTSKVEFYGCTGHTIELTGNVNNAIINGCTLTAEDYAPIIINGDIAYNIRIIDNVITNNKSGSLSGINLQCINTHGVANSIIENNLLICDTQRNIIDISGHGTDIRSLNNVVRNNISVNGGIVIYAAKDIVVESNKVNSISLNGAFLTADYGSVYVVNNIIDNIQFRINSGTPTINYFIQDNVILNETRAITASYDFPSDVHVYVMNNVMHAALSSANNYAAKFDIPVEMYYIPANSSCYVPNGYVVKSEITAITDDTYYNGGIVENDTASDRYIILKRFNILSGQKRLWAQ